MGKSVYLIAALVTTTIFLLVFVIIRVEEESRISSLSRQIQELYEEQQVSKILSTYFNEKGQTDCEVFEKQISRQLNRIYDLFSQLERIKHTTFTISEEQAKRQYLIASMTLWLDLRNASQHCRMNIQPLLFFLSDAPNCVTCIAMIEQLEQLKKACPNARVFAFPAESKEFEFVALLERDFNVTSFPAIVANDKTFYEIIDIAVLKKEIACE